MTYKPELTPGLVRRFAEYLAANPAWGSLHVVLDDHNLSDTDVSAAIRTAREQGDKEGEALAQLLILMSRTQRGTINKRVEMLLGDRMAD